MEEINGTVVTNTDPQQPGEAEINDQATIQSIAATNITNAEIEGAVIKAADLGEVEPNQPEEKAGSKAPEEDVPIKEPEAQPDLAKLLEAANTRAMNSEIRAEALARGVPKERLAYMNRLIDTAGIRLDDADAADKIGAAIDKVLADLPELKGAAMTTGSVGDHPRRSSGLDAFERGFLGIK